MSPILLSIVKAIIAGLLSSIIFYIIVVYCPSKRRRKIATDYFIDLYKRIKIDVLDELISA